MAIITIRDRGRVLGHGTDRSLRPLRIAIGAAAQSLSETLLLCHERACQRRQLFALGDAALKDFGASRADVAYEADKPFWRR
jgi:uncharacterized protein YjiS (DUF1127 family)